MVMLGITLSKMVTNKKKILRKVMKGKLNEIYEVKDFFEINKPWNKAWKIIARYR